MLNILVVEDEAPIREWIVYTISNICEEFKVIGSAINGKEGLELVKKLKPHVVITDIKMPVMDGLELLKNIKSIDSTIEVIILTNHAEFTYAKQSITYGVYEYLIKSEIRPKELKELLQNINEKLLVSDFQEVTDGITTDNIKDNNNYSKSIIRALDFIENNYKKHISLADISKHVYLSHEYFSRLFKEEVGENFITYLTIYRMKKAKELIKGDEMKISEIAKSVGYLNAGYFSKSYKKYMGVSPEEERNNQ